jgi:hypothetical protein
MFANRLTIIGPVLASAKHLGESAQYVTGDRRVEVLERAQPGLMGTAPDPRMIAARSSRVVSPPTNQRTTISTR